MEQKDDGGGERLLNVMTMIKKMARRTRVILPLAQSTFHITRPEGMMERFTPPPPPPPMKLVSSPLACRVHHWAQQVALVLGEKQDVVVFDDAPPAAPDAFDEWLLARIHHGLYAVTYALFLVQQCHSRGLRLWHIVQSRAWTHYFCGLVEQVHRLPRATTPPPVRPKVLRFDVSVVPFTPPSSSTQLPMGSFLLRLVRDALRSNSLTETQLDALVERAYPSATRAKLTTKRHAQVQLAHLIRMVQARRDNHTRRRVIEERQAREWLRAFLAKGCACVQ